MWLCENVKIEKKVILRSIIRWSNIFKLWQILR